jgi:hypothetical protein
MNETRRLYRTLCSHIRENADYYNQGNIWDDNDDRGERAIQSLYDQYPKSQHPVVFNAFCSVFAVQGDFVGWRNRDRWTQFELRLFKLKNNPAYQE